MTILLVRHDETAGNASRVLQRADVPLNERGIHQVQQLARRLLNHGFVHIVCSDLLRARLTAVPLSARSGIAIQESPLLQERNFGCLRGLPRPTNRARLCQGAIWISWSRSRRRSGQPRRRGTTAPAPRQTQLQYGRSVRPAMTSTTSVRPEATVG
jgi:bisphosphoglycerate-dependent phosphoglycerate mutase